MRQSAWPSFLCTPYCLSSLDETVKKITRSALLEVPVELAYQVVVDVEAYPDFLPGCERVEVLKRTDTGVEVKVTVSGAGIKQKFVTVNRHDPNMITMPIANEEW